MRDAVRRVLPRARAALDALVRIPSVSATGAEVHRSAELTARLFRDAGLAEVEVLDGIPGGLPAVLARHPAPSGAPTVLLYAHHDVQPAGDPAAWTSPPFEPSERDGRLYGRGTADNKCGIAAHLVALLAHDGRPPCGVTVLVEGEEEISSPTLGTLLARYRDQLAADVIVLADAENVELGVPAFTTTLRGSVSCVVEVRTLETGVHSGSFGGAAPDALTALCRLLATLHDANGSVAIGGLTTGTAPAVDYPERRLRAEAGILDGVALLGTGSVAERLWAKPAVAVLALDATPVEWDGEVGGVSGQFGSGAAGSQLNRQCSTTATAGSNAARPRTIVDFAVPFSPRTSTPPIVGCTAFSSSARRKSSWPTMAANGYLSASPELTRVVTSG